MKKLLLFLILVELFTITASAQYKTQQKSSSMVSVYSTPSYKQSVITTANRSAAVGICDGTDIRIFPSANPQSEVHISIDRNNPSNLVGSANTYTTTYQQGRYYSTDNGNTWKGSDELVSGVSVNGDPSTDIDADGTMYISTMISTGDGYALLKSTDKGSTWSSFLNSITGGDFDKNMIASDNQTGSPYKNNLYCAWTDFSGSTSVKFNRTTNGGTNFSTPIILRNSWGQGANVQTGPNGEVYVCWADYTNGSLPAQGLGFTSSIDGGSTFKTSSVVFNYTGIRTNNGANSTFNNIRVNDFPSMAVDKSGGSRNGRIYVCYPAQSNGKSVIQLRFSDDKGVSWSSAKEISISNGRQSWFPWIAVDNVTGNVFVAYYSFDTSSGFETNTYVAFSVDGGTNFSNQRVSDVSHVTSSIDNTIFADGYAGDYIGIVAHASNVYAAWTDNRNGTWQIYVSPVSVLAVPVITGPKTYGPWCSVCPDTRIFTYELTTVPIGANNIVWESPGSINSYIYTGNLITGINSTKAGTAKCYYTNSAGCNSPTATFTSNYVATVCKYYYGSCLPSARVAEDSEDPTKPIVSQNISIYPNPTMDKSATVDISLDVPSTVVIHVFDSMGKTVSIKDLGYLDLGNYSSAISFAEGGIYILKIISGSDVHVKRLAVK